VLLLVEIVDIAQYIFDN